MNKYGYEGQVGCAAINFRAGASPKEADSVELQTVQQLEQWLGSNAGLPTYACPRFLRVLVDVSDKSASERDQLGISDDVGSERVSLMMKKLKTGLRKEGTLSTNNDFLLNPVNIESLTDAGFNLPPACQDRMYWIEREGQGFVKLRPEAEQLLINGRARL